MHARFLKIGNRNMDFRNVVEYPFFVPSELSPGVQLADLVAYIFYHTLKYAKAGYPYLLELLPNISRHAHQPDRLAGLKIWPQSSKFDVVFAAIQNRVNKD